MIFGHRLHLHVIACCFFGVCPTTVGVNLDQIPFAPIPSKGFLFAPGHPIGAQDDTDSKIQKKSDRPLPVTIVPVVVQGEKTTARTIMNTWVKRMWARPRNASEQLHGCSVISVMSPKLDVIEDEHVLENAWAAAVEAAVRFQGDTQIALRCIGCTESATDTRHVKFLLDHTIIFEALTALLKRHSNNQTTQHTLLPMITRYSSSIVPKAIPHLQSAGTFQYVFTQLNRLNTWNSENAILQMDLISFLSGIAKDMKGGQIIIAYNGTQIIMELLKNHPQPYYGSHGDKLTLKYAVLNLFNGLLQNNLGINTLLHEGLVKQIIYAMQSEPLGRATQDIACADMAYLTKKVSETIYPLVREGAIDFIINAFNTFKEDDPTRLSPAPGQTLGNKFPVIPWCAMALQSLGGIWEIRVHMIRKGVLQVIESVRPEMQNSVQALRNILLEAQRKIAWVDNSHSLP